MSFFDPQNPGIGGLKELTNAEQLFLTTFAGVSWTPGSILFVGSDGNITQDNANFFWDDTNNRLGIGTTTPYNKLDISTSSGEFASITPTINYNTFTGYKLNVAGGTTRAGLFINPSSGEIKIGATNGGGYYPTFYTSNGEAMRISTTGNVGIGTTLPIDKLDVTGTGKAVLTSSGGLNIYGSLYTDASNYARGVFQLNGNEFQIITEKAGSPTMRDISITPGTGRALYFGSNGVSYKWYITSTGDLLTTDNTYNIGASLATRPKNLYTAGLTYLGKPTAGGNSQVLYIGHNGTTTSSGDGVSQIQFNSQYDNYPFKMGAEGNGYNFYIRQTNGGQGTFAWNFGTISSTLYTLDLQYVTDHYEQIFGGKWLSTFSGSGTTDYYGLKNTITPNSTSVIYDTFRIEKGQAQGFYPASNDPIVSLFNGASTGTITEHNRYVARFNRLGFLGIGTTNTYAAPNTMQQAAVTIDLQSRSGLKTTDGTTALQVVTSGSSTSVSCLGNVNGERALGLIVGSRITANGLTRTIVSLTNSTSFVVDSAVDWSNGGAGYNFTYTNQYVSYQDGATKYFTVDAIGATKVRVGTTTSKQAIVGGKVKEFYASVGNIGTGEDDLYTYTTEASLLGTNGDEIEGSVGGTFVSSATATRQIRMYFGGTLIFDTGALSLSTSSSWVISYTIIRVSSSVVRYRVNLSTQGAALSAYTSSGEVTGLTLSNTNIWKITGESAGVGAATDDIVAMSGDMFWWPVSQ